MDKDDAVEYFLSVRSRELDKMIARDAELVYYRQHTPNLELEIRNLVQKVKVGNSQEIIFDTFKILFLLLHLLKGLRKGCRTAVRR